MPRRCAIIVIDAAAAAMMPMLPPHAAALMFTPLMRLIAAARLLPFSFSLLSTPFACDNAAFGWLLLPSFYAIGLCIITLIFLSMLHDLLFASLRLSFSAFSF